jgi:hypothetical protein
MTDRELKIWNEIRADPEYKDKTDEQLKKLMQEIIIEDDLPIEYEERKDNYDLIFQFETIIKLLDKPKLIGFLIQLRLFAQINFLTFRNQVDLASNMGISEPTFKNRRNQLVRIGLLDIERERRIKYKINSMNRIYDFKMPFTSEEKKKYLKNLQKKLVARNNDWIEQQKEGQAQLAMIEAVKEKAIEIVQKKEEAKKKEERKFPGIDYRVVLDGYTKYKGVSILGPEILRAKHAIKQMFLAERTPQQIVDCMKFFSENKNSDEFKWLKSWTLETVMKKMPEFVAGTFNKNSGFGLPEYK